MKIRSALPVSVVAAVVLAVPGAAGPSSPVETAHAEEVLVRRARYPVRIVENRAGACDELDPRRVEMLIGGVPAEIDAIERNRLETIHAVLIDTSPSMKARGRLERATEAARGYVRSLPENEPVLLATFDEDLVLRLRPTRERDALDRALHGISAGAYTALNDALYHTIRYLGPRPERKVIVVMTDGCDSASLTTHPFQAVLDLAAEAENLSVFPIGIDLPSRCSGGLSRIGPVVGPDSSLHRLGALSGGELFRVEQAAEFSSVFTSIRERLEQEGHVVYRPPAASAPPSGQQRGRKIRIRALDLKGCRVERAGSSLRFEELEDRGIQVSREGAPIRTAALPREVLLDVRFPEPWHTVVDNGSGFLTLEPGRISGRLPDIEVDRGPLYSERVYRRSGRYRALLDLFAGYHVREFRLDVPELEVVQRQLTGPAALARYLIERGAPPFTRDEQGEIRLSPGWIHGQTLLESRSLLARALYGYDGYRQWADARLGSMEREDLRRLLEQSGLEAQAQRAFMATVERRGYVPRPSDPQRVLADWLGDLTPARLAAEIDREGADAAIGGASTASPAGVREIWPRLLSWFPPPTRFRVIAPLLPVYEAERDVIGFYRIVLPVSMERQPPGGLPPVAPIGTLLAERLGMEGARVTGLEYPEIDKPMRSSLRRFARRRGRGKPWAVRLDLRRADGNEQTVTGYFLLAGDVWSREPRDNSEPVLACVDFDPAHADEAPSGLRPCAVIRAASR